MEKKMLTWLKRRVGSVSAAAGAIDMDDEAQAVRLVYETFGPGVVDVTPTRRLEEPPTAA